jgi:hypothetical protein
MDKCVEGEVKENGKVARRSRGKYRSPCFDIMVAGLECCGIHASNGKWRVDEFQLESAMVLANGSF